MAKIVIIETKAKIYQEGKKAQLFHCHQSAVNYCNKNGIELENKEELHEFYRKRFADMRSF